jgi:hypothetical protein
MNTRARANQLRRIADEMDPPTVADPEPFVVEVTLTLDGHDHRTRTFPMPCIGDGAWGHFGHEGQVLHDLEGTPTRRERWGVSVKRVKA